MNKLIILIWLLLQQNNKFIRLLCIFFFLNNVFFLNYFIDSSQFSFLTLFWRFLHFLNDTQYNIVFFFILFCLLQKNTNHLKLFFSFFLLITLKFEIQTYNSFFNSFWVLNITLTNGLCLIHPILVYILYIYLLSYIFKKYNIFYYWVILNMNSKNLVYNFIALILGSWWAYQELNWGGWWNWDFVELILLIFFIKLIILKHMLRIVNFFYMYIFNFVFFFYLLLFFIFVRWDILNSIHSFNVISSFENYINYLFFLFIALICIYLVILVKTYTSIKTPIVTLRRLTLNNFTNLFLNVFIYMIILFFIYNLKLTVMTETDQNENIYFLKFFIILSILLIFSVTNTKINWVFFLFVVFIACFNYLLFFLSIIFLIKKPFKFLIKITHIFILLSFIFFAVSCDLQVVEKLNFNLFSFNDFFMIKNTFLIQINNISNNINILNNYTNNSNQLVESVLFFNIKQKLLSFFLMTTVGSFVISSSSYLLLLIWFFTILLSLVFYKLQTKKTCVIY